MFPAQVVSDWSVGGDEEGDGSIKAILILLGAPSKDISSAFERMLAASIAESINGELFQAFPVGNQTSP